MSSSSQSPTGDLAKALELLNGRLVPSSDVAMPPPAEKLVELGDQLKSVHVFQLKQTTLLCLEFTQELPLAGVKLLDPTRKVPLIASAGVHSPGSLASSGAVVFAQWPNLDLTGVAQLTIGVLGAAAPYGIQGVVPQRFTKESLHTVHAYFSRGPSAMAALFKAQRSNASELKTLVKSLNQLQAQSANVFLGKVDAVLGGMIEGWLWNPAQPNKRFEVQAWLGDRLVGYGLANVWREDLAQAGKGDGRVKFEVKVAHALNDGQQHLVQMKIVDSDTHQIIQELGKPLAYQHVNKSFAFAIKPEIMGCELDRRMVKALLKKANLGPNGQAIEAGFRKVSMHLENLDYKSARQLINGLMQLGFDNGFSRTKLAESYLVEGDFVQAVDIFKQVASKAKDFVWAYLGLGYVYERLFDVQHAIAAYQHALTISPNLSNIASRVEALQAEFSLGMQAEHEQSPAALEGLIKHAQRGLIANASDYTLSQKIHGFQLQLKTLAGAHVAEPVEYATESIALRRLRHARIYLQSCLNHAKSY